MTGGQEGRPDMARVTRIVRSPSTSAVEDSYSAHFHLSRSENPDGTLPVEGLRTIRAFAHRAVMVAEVVELFRPVPAGTILDMTVGGGGHAEAILTACEQVRVVGLDRDPQAVAAARARLAHWGERAIVEHARFDAFASVLGGDGAGALAGALFDLGVSSTQLDSPERGFSYRQDGPLDMRMDQGDPLTAAELVNNLSEEALVELLKDNGETRFARAIARAIVAARPLQRTAQLADAVARAVPAGARRRGHPASRVFQALRTRVNAELDILAPTLDAVLGSLVPGGRCVVLSYHSGEDRSVKECFGFAATGGCSCPRALGCVCGARPWVRLLNRGARMPSAEEVATNPRAASARLRAVERIDAPAGAPAR